LIAEILNIPLQNFDLIVDISSQQMPNRDAKETLLAALDQGSRLIYSVLKKLLPHLLYHYTPK